MYSYLGNTTLGQRLGDDPARDVGQPFVPSLVAEGQAFMIQAEQMQDGGVHVVDMHLPVDRAQADGVGGSESLAASDSAPGQPAMARPSWRAEVQRAANGDRSCARP